MSKLAGTFLVAGMGTTGVGVATAAKVVERGGRVVLSCFPKESVIASTERQAEKMGLSDPLIIPCDLTDDDSVEALTEKLRIESIWLAGVAHSVANAPGTALAKTSVMDLTLSEQVEALDASAKSLPRLVRHLLGSETTGRRVLADQASVVTLTFHLAVDRVVPSYAAMAGAKALLELYVRYLACELGPLGICVNSVDAGPMRTTASAGVGGFREMLKAAAEVAPIGRNITANDAANAVCFLLSQESNAITGTMLTVDGGLCLVANTTPPSLLWEVEELRRKLAELEGAE